MSEEFKAYIRRHSVQARPMTRGEFAEQNPLHESINPEGNPDDAGYHVIHTFGEFWSLAKPFYNLWEESPHNSTNTGEACNGIRSESRSPD